MKNNQFNSDVTRKFFNAMIIRSSRQDLKSSKVIRYDLENVLPCEAIE
jgi:hypothetical protein